MRNTSILTAILIALAGQPPAPAAPFVQYTALSDAARKAGKLAKYDSCATTSSTLSLGDYKLKLTVPRTAAAYDVVPIRYTLTRPAGARRAAVEAVAFEDPAKARSKPLYDLAIPGNIGVKLDYLGSVCADFDPSVYRGLGDGPKSPTCPFPPLKRDHIVRSSTIREAQAIWFKFRLTNTGDTILDPEGFGAAFFEPHIIKLDKDGKEEWTAGTVNMFERFLTYLYPGESTEIWVNYWTPKFGAYCRGLREGDYKLQFTMVYRYHRDYNWGINIWTGAWLARLTVPIKVQKQAEFNPATTQFEMIDKDEKMPGDFDSFEEFMTAFRIYNDVPAKPTVQKGVVYLQVAPWTRQAVVKLILTDAKQIAVARVPIKVTTESLRIKYNPRNVMVIKDSKGIEQPAVVTQAMPGMRIGFQLGPYPEQHMLEQIREMKDLGINVLANTGCNWLIYEVNGSDAIDLSAACYKYWWDVLVPKMGMRAIGWSTYPPSGVYWYDTVFPLLGHKVTYTEAGAGYNGMPRSVDLADPVVPEVIAAWTKFNYDRWGSNWFRTRDGRMPIDIEDTRGFLRDDINLRYLSGPLTIARFREWVKEKYGSLESVNKAWGSHLTGFDQIDPESNQGIEGDNLPHGPVYNKPDHIFHDWNAAVADWDIFRTELRLDTYRRTNEILRRSIPGAELALRTEGANFTIDGSPDSPDMHSRHVYYSQRRNAMVQSVVDKANIIHFFSDYTTLPYTEAEWRQAMREMVAKGIIPVFLPQFDHMRDILLNPYYGRQYQLHYNLDKPSKGMMVHCLTAAYPWWKATYEEGGAPGILYSDYLADGFATETQKRELKLLHKHFATMKR